MISDLQLAIFANVLGVSLFLLVVLYHYVAVNNPKNKEKEWKSNSCEEWRRGGGDEGRRVDSSKDNIPYIPRERKGKRKMGGKKQKMISFEVPRETIHFALQIVGSGSTNSPEAEVQVRHVIFRVTFKICYSDSLSTTLTTTDGPHCNDRNSSISRLV